MKRELLLAAALGLAVFGPSLALAQGRSAPTAQSHEHGQTSDDAGQPNALVQIVRGATERFRDPVAAEAEGYRLMFGCVSAGDLCDAFGGADGLSPDRRPDASTKLLSKSGSRKD